MGGLGDLRETPVAIYIWARSPVRLRLEESKDETEQSEAAFAKLCPKTQTEDECLIMKVSAKGYVYINGMSVGEVQ